MSRPGGNWVKVYDEATVRHHHALRPGPVSLDRHATYIAATFLAGAAR